MIPTCNCAEYLRTTLEGVLSQDPGPELMQIEVIDDCSTRDDPEAVVANVAGGRVTFFRQPRNVGHTANFDTCISRSRGHLVHLLHGDDCVRQGFYPKLGCAFAARSDIGAAFCRQIPMDEHGHWQVLSHLERGDSGVLGGWLERIAVGQRLQPPAMVVHREIYERLAASIAGSASSAKTGRCGCASSRTISSGVNLSRSRSTACARVRSRAAPSAMARTSASCAASSRSRSPIFLATSPRRWRDGAREQSRSAAAAGCGDASPQASSTCCAGDSFARLSPAADPRGSSRGCCCSTRCGVASGSAPHERPATPRGGRTGRRRIRASAGVGDDPDLQLRRPFYEKMQRPFAKEHDVGAAFCHYISVDDRNHWQTTSPLEQPQSGVLPGWLEKLAVGQRLQTPCMVVRREVYESLGAFDDRLGLGEDWEMWVRIAAHYPVWYEVEPLALHRVGSASITARAMRTGQNVEDIVRAIDTIPAHLPPQRADALRAEAREIAATTALRRARRAIDSGQGTVARAQVRSALRVSRSPAVLLALGHTLARLALARARRTPDQAGT